MLTKDEYRQWAKDFCKQQGISFDSDMLTVDAWHEALGHYSLDELENARKVIAMSPKSVPTRLADYRGWIHRLVHEGRAVVAQSERVQAQDQGECCYCFNSGMVSVPHPRCVHNGRWVPLKIGALSPAYHTLAVFCSCRLGVWKYTAFRPSKDYIALSLADYAAKNPDWREQLLQRADELSGERRAAGLDGKDTIGALADKWKIPA